MSTQMDCFTYNWRPKSTHLLKHVTKHLIYHYVVPCSFLILGGAFLHSRRRRMRLALWYDIVPIELILKNYPLSKRLLRLVGNLFFLDDEFQIFNDSSRRYGVNGRSVTGYVLVAGHHFVDFQLKSEHFGPRPLEILFRFGQPFSKLHCLVSLAQRRTNMIANIGS